MNIAILIDAENVVPGHADLIFSHAKELGSIVSREIYGAASALTSWVGPVLKYAIHPNLTIKAAKGKNSSDIALVIGAMDLLAAGGVDGVIIASSDSDFSALSVRLRNAGIDVIGMGNEKANALWRTACSSFVVLQNQKPSPPAKQPQKPQPQKQEPRKQEPRKQEAAAESPVAASHRERVAVIGRAIASRLKPGDRVQVSTLFPMLNKLPEYKVDRQGSGKRPLNYLTSTYGDLFRFESTPDGKSWVSLPDAEGAVTEEKKPGEAAVGAAPEAAPVEAAPAEAPAAEPEQAGDEGYVTPEQIVERLVDGGFDAEIARQVTDIFAGSSSYRAAYNKLRSVFGSTAGRDYYQQAKQILTDR